MSRANFFAKAFLRGIAMKKTLAVAAVLSVVCPVMMAQGRRGAEPTGPQTWRNIGPDRGGRSLAVAGSSARPLEYYFGAVGGGLWKTVDGGLTWKPVTDGQIHSSSVGAVDVSESN